MPSTPVGARPRLEKAYLSLMAADSAGGGMGGGNLGQLTFTFNPKDYSVQKSANWQRTALPGAPAVAYPEFTGSEPKSMTLEIFLDKSEATSGGVVHDVDLLFTCVAPTAASISANKPSPPLVVFGWGSTTSFTAFVKSVSAHFTMFRQDGTPIRATCQVTLEEFAALSKRQNPTSGGKSAHRTYQVVAGDSLASIAFREYRNPNLWRAIAEANGIDDPLRIASGTTLLIPEPNDAEGL